MTGPVLGSIENTKMCLELCADNRISLDDNQIEYITASSIENTFIKLENSLLDDDKRYVVDI